MRRKDKVTLITRTASRMGKLEANAFAKQGTKAFFYLIS